MNTWFCEKEFIQYASARATPALTIMVYQFSFSIEHIQVSKNFLVDSLTQELSNGDHQSRTLTEKGENP